MATWRTPSTWASGTIITSTFLDNHIKDQFDYLGTTHRHSTGTAGEGAGYLGPIAYMDNLTAKPAPATSATLARLYATGTSVNYLTSASATYAFANSTHSHLATAGATFVAVLHNESVQGRSVTIKATYNDENEFHGSLVTTASGTVGVHIVAVAPLTVSAVGTASATRGVTGRLIFEGAEVYSTTFSSVVGSGTYKDCLMVMSFATLRAAGGATWDCTAQFKANNSDYIFQTEPVVSEGVQGALTITEFKYS